MNGYRLTMIAALTRMIACLCVFYGVYTQDWYFDAILFVTHEPSILSTTDNTGQYKFVPFLKVFDTA